MISRTKIYYHSFLTFEFSEQNFKVTNTYSLNFKIPSNSNSKNYFQVQFFFESLLKTDFLDFTFLHWIKLSNKFIFNFLDILLCCFMKQNFITFWNLSGNLKLSFFFWSSFSKKLTFMNSSTQVFLNATIFPLFTKLKQVKISY